MKNFSPFRASLIAFCIALSACGGGGGGSGGGTTPIGSGDGGDTETPPTGTFAGTINFDAALTEVMQFNPGVTVLEAYRKDSANGTLQFTQMGWGRWRASESFQGVVRQRTDQEVFIGDTRGTILSQFTTGVYFDSAPIRIHGFIGTDATVSIANPTGLLPTAGRVGESGPLYTYITYTDSSLARVESRGTTTWAIKASTPDTVFACLETKDVEVSGETVTSSECYETVPATNRFNRKLRLTASDGSTTIVFNKDRPS